MNILEHIEAGRVDLIELGVYTYLALKANGAAVEVAATTLRAACKQVSVRTLQRKLRHLEQLGLIKTSKAPGTNGLYSVLICGAPVAELVGDAHRLNGECATDWHNPVSELVGEPDGVSRPAVSCPENIDDDGRDHRHGPAAPGNPLPELGVANLPDRNSDFVELCAATPRSEGENLIEWATRMRRLCDSKNVFFPRAVHARVRQAAA